MPAVDMEILKMEKDKDFIKGKKALHGDATRILQRVSTTHQEVRSVSAGELQDCGLADRWC